MQEMTPLSKAQFRQGHSPHRGFCYLTNANQVSDYCLRLSGTCPLGKDFLQRACAKRCRVVRNFGLRFSVRSDHKISTFH
jgi:hypothetical protein